MTIRPLSGVGVVEVATSLASRLCARLLADAGAHVTRFELEDSGDGNGSEPSVAWSTFLNLGKTVKRHQSAQEMHDALQSATLYITSLRHDSTEGASPSCLSALGAHPHLIVSCVTPFGQDGPYTDFSADDAVLSSLCGLADATPGFPDRTAHLDDPPVQSLVPLAEFAGGLTAACATFGAVYSRLLGDTGPRHVEVATLEAAAAMMVYEWSVASYGGHPVGRRPIDHPIPEPNALLPCADGSAVVVAFREEHWAALVELMGSPAWASAPEFADGRTRGKNWRRLHKHLSAWTGTLAGRDLMELAQGRGLPCSYALELSETLAHAQTRVRGSVLTAAGSVMPADPVIVDSERRSRLEQSPAEPLPARSVRGTAEAAEPMPAGPLAGVTVLDLSHMIAGPVCGQHLAALGANVVLVESVRYPASRSFPPFAAEPARDSSAIFNHVNRGKRSVELDLTTDGGRELLLELVASADVLVENLSTDAAAKLDLGYSTLAAVNAGLVLVSISGLGRSGPWGDYAAFHSSVIALSGLASVTKDPTGRPRLVGSLYPDPLSGTFAALAAQQGLLAREQTGRGCHIEVSMMDVALNAMAGLVDAAAGGASFDGSPVRFTRVADGWLVAETDTALPKSAASRNRSDVMAELQAQGAPAGAVLDLTEVVGDPHLRARGFVVEDDHPVVRARPVPGVPWRYDDARPQLGHAPCFGDSTSEVMHELVGLDPDEISRLRAEHVLE